MNTPSSFESTYDSADQVVCACLRVTHSELVTAISVLEIRSIREFKQKTGAGDGCTACHCRLQCLLDERAHAAGGAPICSVR